MINRRIVLLTAVAGAIGIVVGAAVGSWFWLSFNAAFMSAGLLTRYEADIVTKVAVLENLRAGRPEDATRLLETLLDADLMGAATFVQEGKKISANTRHAAELERRARVTSGYQPIDASVRTRVDEAFRLLPNAAVQGGAQPRAPGDARTAARP